MGVTGLWTVVQPCARPIKLETLNKKRLAVDASIWIYQFLKAVRDKEGNALRNSHVVGFFRRICKLLFVGIQPVFVFDGGAPALKRQTIRARKSRREGRKEDAVRTAGKLLALQMQRAAEDEEEKRRRERDEARRREEEEEVVDEGKLVYVDELQMTQQERQQNRRFRKKDQYHLPELDASLAEMGAPNDPRIMSLEELEAYARQFDTGEDINVYDFNKIDFDSPFFTSLPASDRYNILNAARLRSRLRMGYSKDQLDTMFPNRMDFSRFQIERVTERNELTQRLMNINGMNDDMMWGINGTGRVAGEKGREYVLVKNDGVEGGWALGVVSGRDEGEKEKPIDVDELGERARQQDEEEEQSEEDFEDVPIEGLNRLPKQTSGPANAAQQEINRQRRALYAKRRSGKSRSSRPKRTRPVTQPDDPESLFVADEEAAESSEEEAIEDNGEMHAEEDEELNRAIAMSLQREDEEGAEPAEEEEKDDNYLGVFQQKRVEEAPNFKGTAGSSGLAIARQVNARANKAPKSTVFQAESDSEDEKQDQPNGSQSPRRGKVSDKTKPSADQQRASRIQASVTEASRPKPKSNGPLPFEKLDLGNSLFGKKLEKIEEKNAGGFEKAGEKKDEARPLPPWFAGNIEEDIAQQNAIEKADREQARKYKEDQQFQFDEPSVLKRKETGEVIDLEAEESLDQPKQVLVIDDEDEEPDQTEKVTGEAEKTEDEENEDVTMGDMADDAKINPPAAESPTQRALPPVIHDPAVEKPPEDRRLALQAVEGGKGGAKAAESDEEIEWSASEDESKPVSKAIDTATTANPSSPARAVPSRSGSPDFEDVQIPAQPDPVSERANVLSTQIDQQTAAKDHTSGLADQNAPAEDEDDYGLATDSEDEDLMRQLEIEAQEHARFASELNQKSQQQNIAEYERELKQLRTQQKKDRRDADEVTQIMITECQQLLRLFGLPYITAPMEAEAQCAELVHLGLVDGIVTDDSDCFLFGGTRIYKNMFNQAKFVECYLLSDLEKEFDLTRKKLIGIAHLLGSDYTEGVPGIGPVSALEILSEFQDLEKFRDWWSGVQEGRVKKEEDMGFAFRRKFRKNATKLFLPHVFPDPRVEMAYLQPEVDSDPSEFQWGVPDLDALRSFLMATIGWSQERTDEVLVPVIRDMNRRQEEGTQSNITKFFAGGTGAGAYAPRVRAAETSKRLGGALGRMAERAQRKRAGKDGEVEEVGGDAGDEVEPAVSAAVEDANDAARPKKSRKRKSAAANEDNDEDADFAEEQSKGRKKRKAPARRKKAAADDSDD
ncbi:XPG-like protein [Elsinoe australis]|uniref:XPG-like protein n=1 Tax=Elsinoe australis TaxID=40998 RepID=A0A4U7AKI0_9PEZI|nr:XPG-like protein [Elsinoe australis]